MDIKPDNNQKNKSDEFFENIKNSGKELEILFIDGEKIKGYIEWFDRWNLKLIIEDQECLVYRHAIKSYNI